VLHGFTALDCEEACVVNVPTLPYRYVNPDEYRYPWDSRDIPYTWPACVTRGG
jgi:dTDP-4-dehydrorhamnose 3,5-epimerase